MGLNPLFIGLLLATVTADQGTQSFFLSPPMERKWFLLSWDFLGLEDPFLLGPSRCGFFQVTFESIWTPSASNTVKASPC